MGDPTGGQGDDGKLRGPGTPVFVPHLHLLCRAVRLWEEPLIYLEPQIFHPESLGNSLSPAEEARQPECLALPGEGGRKRVFQSVHW